MATGSAGVPRVAETTHARPTGNGQLRSANVNHGGRASGISDESDVYCVLWISFFFVAKMKDVALFYKYQYVWR